MMDRYIRVWVLAVDIIRLLAGMQSTTMLHWCYYHLHESYVWYLCTYQKKPSFVDYYLHEIMKGQRNPVTQIIKTCKLKSV